MNRIYWVLIGIGLALLPSVANADAYWESCRW